MEKEDYCLTDREFCQMFKIDRATSLRWRTDQIVGSVKLPGGQVRYLRKHVEEFIKRFEKSAALKNSNGAIQGRVVEIGISKGRDYGTVA